MATLVIIIDLFFHLGEYSEQTIGATNEFIT